MWRPPSGPSLVIIYRLTWTNPYNDKGAYTTRATASS
jgi:hypothetical protein